MSKPTFINGPEISKLEIVHNDDRRTIREAELRMHDGAIRRVTHIAIKGAGVLGQHYHPVPEHFTILNGNPSIHTAPHDDLQSITAHTFPDGGHITMEPGQVHTFEFGEHGGDLISSMDGAFDPANLIPAKLDLPIKK